MSLDTDAIDQRILSRVGEEVTHLPAGGGSVTVQAFPQMPDETLDTLELEMEASSPRIAVRSTEALNVTHADQFIVRGVTYNVDRVEEDETTMLIVHLEEA